MPRAAPESPYDWGAVFETLPVGVEVVSAAGATALHNREIQPYLAGEALHLQDPGALGRPAPQGAGRPLDPADFPGARALRGEAVVPGLELQYVRDDGTAVWTRVSAVPVRNAAGAVTGQVTAVTDIDTMKRAEAALREVHGARSAGRGPHAAPGRPQQRAARAGQRLVERADRAAAAPALGPAPARTPRVGPPGRPDPAPAGDAARRGPARRGPGGELPGPGAARKPGAPVGPGAAHPHGGAGAQRPRARAGRAHGALDGGGIAHRAGRPPAAAPGLHRADPPRPGLRAARARGAGRRLDDRRGRPGGDRGLAAVSGRGEL